MKSEDRLKRVFAALLEAVRRDAGLAAEIERALGQPEQTRSTTAPRNRRRPAAFDPYVVYAQGEAALRTRLHDLDAEALKDIVSEHGMDPAKLVRKWKSPERIADHIVTTVQARSRKGDAFRT